MFSLCSSASPHARAHCNFILYAVHWIHVQSRLPASVAPKRKCKRFAHRQLAACIRHLAVDRLVSGQSGSNADDRWYDAAICGVHRSSHAADGERGQQRQPVAAVSLTWHHERDSYSSIWCNNPKRSSANTSDALLLADYTGVVHWWKCSQITRKKHHSMRKIQLLVVMRKAIFCIFRTEFWFVSLMHGEAPYCTIHCIQLLISILAYVQCLMLSCRPSDV